MPRGCGFCTRPLSPEPYYSLKTGGVYCCLIHRENAERTAGYDLTDPRITGATHDFVVQDDPLYEANRIARESLPLLSSTVDSGAFTMEKIRDAIKLLDENDTGLLKIMVANDYRTMDQFQRLMGYESLAMSPPPPFMGVRIEFVAALPPGWVMLVTTYRDPKKLPEFRMINLNGASNVK